MLNSYQQLRGLVLKRLQRPDIADLFSMPEEDSSKHEFVWYTNLAGTITPFDALPAEQRPQREADLQAKLAALQGLARQIRAEASSDRRSLEAEIIEAALNIPDDTCKFMVGEQPVLAAWGASPVNSNRAPVDVVWRAGVPQRPVAAPGTTVADGAAGVSTGAAPAARPEQAPARPWSWAWLRYALWLIPILAGILVAILLYRLGPLDRGIDFASHFRLPSWGSGSTVDAGKGPTWDSRRAASSEVGKEDELRREIADLRRQLASRLDACVAPPRQGGVAPGQGLSIPADALTKKDLSFLEGCWDAPSVTVTKLGTPQETNEQAEAVLCFAGDGKSGQRTVRNVNLSCEGPLTAELADDGVTITAPEAACRGTIPSFVPAKIVCRLKGTQTDCEVTQSGVPYPVNVTFTRRAKP
ncbi:MAG: hypothetical protein FJ187_04010 [Gammaproteobacteria bacterium]|nr:hypothetical protein [Gammaproteobacteria bacterium]